MVDLKEILPIAVNVTILIAAGYAGTVWLKRWLKAQVSEPLSRVHHQVTANEGSSLHDIVDRTEHKVDQVEVEVASLTRRFEDHLTLGHGGGRELH